MTSLSFSRNFSLIFRKVFLKFLSLSRDAKSVSEWSLIVEGYFAGKSLYFLYFTAIKNDFQRICVESFSEVFIFYRRRHDSAFPLFFICMM